MNFKMKKSPSQVSKCPVHLVPRYFVRLIHFSTTLFTFTIITLDMLFDFLSSDLARKNNTFKLMQTIFGLGMIFSGLLLTYFMKKDSSAQS